MDAIVDQLVLGRHLAIPGNSFDSVDGSCEVKQKGANWNQKGTKWAPTVNQRATKMHQQLMTERRLFQERKKDAKVS